MRASDTLKKRLDEIESILRSTKNLEKRQRSNVRSHFQKEQLIASLRATAYVMLYNALEEAIRSALKSIREKIESESVLFSEVSEFWRLDLVQAAFLDRMQSGTNHGNVLSEIIPITGSALVWGEKKRERLPFSGNFGQASALKLRDWLALSWSAPSHTLGGSDLENIRERRNALAHGLESFEEAGSKITTPDLIAVLKRVRVFMVSYIEALESYRDNRGYLTSVPSVQRTVSNREGIPDFSSEEPLQSGA